MNIVLLTSFYWVQLGIHSCYILMILFLSFRYLLNHIINIIGIDSIRSTTAKEFEFEHQERRVDCTDRSGWLRKGWDFVFLSIFHNIA